MRYKTGEYLNIVKQVPNLEWRHPKGDYKGSLGSAPAQAQGRKLFASSQNRKGSRVQGTSLSRFSNTWYCPVLGSVGALLERQLLGAGLGCGRAWCAGTSRYVPEQHRIPPRPPRKQRLYEAAEHWIDDAMRTGKLEVLTPSPWFSGLAEAGQAMQKVLEGHTAG